MFRIEENPDKMKWHLQVPWERRRSVRYDWVILGYVFISSLVSRWSKILAVKLHGLKPPPAFGKFIEPVILRTKMLFEAQALFSLSRRNHDMVWLKTWSQICGPSRHPKISSQLSWSRLPLQNRQIWIQWIAGAQKVNIDLRGFSVFFWPFLSELIRVLSKLFFLGVFLLDLFLVVTIALFAARLLLFSSISGHAWHSGQTSQVCVSRI